jgi:hypothetical protein
MTTKIILEHLSECIESGDWFEINHENAVALSGEIGKIRENMDMWEKTARSSAAAYNLAVQETIEATRERDEARRQLRECRRERDERSAVLHEIMSFDIEDYVQSLPWSDAATDDEKTLVAGNLRRLYFKLISTDSALVDGSRLS